MSVGSSESQLGLAIGGYRVFVPPRDSVEEAYDLLQLFRAQGFDSYVMTQGIYARGISLGVFSSDLAVQSLIDQLGQTLRGYAEVVDVSPMQGDFMLQASAQTAAHGLVRWVQAQAEELTMPLPGVTPEAFRVFVPPSGSLEQAYKLRKVFRKKGFDSYVMTQGLAGWRDIVGCVLLRECGAEAAGSARPRPQTAGRGWAMPPQDRVNLCCKPCL